MAGGGGEKAGNAPDGRGFAGAVGSEESENLAGVGGERDVVDGGEIAVGFAEVVDFDHCESQGTTAGGRMGGKADGLPKS